MIFFVESHGIWLTSSKYFFLQFFTSIKSFNINTKGDSSEKGMLPAIYECVMNKSYFHLAFMKMTKSYFLLFCLKAGGSVAGCHAFSWQQHSGLLDLSTWGQCHTKDKESSFGLQVLELWHWQVVKDKGNYVEQYQMVPRTVQKNSMTADIISTIAEMLFNFASTGLQHPSRETFATFHSNSSTHY